MASLSCFSISVIHASLPFYRKWALKNEGNVEKDSGERAARRPRSATRRRGASAWSPDARGRSYEKIAREERVTARRVREIVAERLETRDAELAQALRVAEALVVAGEIRAMAPLMKLLDEAQRRLPRRRAKVAEKGA